MTSRAGDFENSFPGKMRQPEMGNMAMNKDFLEEEIRWDYLITKKQKKVWAKELEILQYFDEICKKHNLKYHIDCGTLLGAVRHQGYIPWDDDIDVTMCRPDYEIFKGVVSETR